MKENEIPEGFTLRLAIVDAVPVLEFGVAMLVLATKFHSGLFAFGAICCFLAGSGKVIWKILLATKKKNILWLNKQFRYVMSTGFALMLIALIFNRKSLSFKAIFAAVTGFPACIFFLVGIAGMCVMGVFGAKLDNSVVANNWKEQIVNLIAQGMILIGIILC